MEMTSQAADSFSPIAAGALRIEWFLDSARSEEVRELCSQSVCVRGEPPSRELDTALVGAIHLSNRGRRVCLQALEGGAIDSDPLRPRYTPSCCGGSHVSVLNFARGLATVFSESSAYDDTPGFQADLSQDEAGFYFAFLRGFKDTALFSPATNDSYAIVPNDEFRRAAHAFLWSFAAYVRRNAGDLLDHSKLGALRRVVYWGA